MKIESTPFCKSVFIFNFSLFTFTLSHINIWSWRSLGCVLCLALPGNVVKRVVYNFCEQPNKESFLLFCENHSLYSWMVIFYRHKFQKVKNYWQKESKQLYCYVYVHVTPHVVKDMLKYEMTIRKIILTYIYDILINCKNRPISCDKNYQNAKLISGGSWLFPWLLMTSNCWELVWMTVLIY